MDDLLLRAGVDPAAQIITFLGRISEVKGVDLLLASFMATAAEFPAAHLIVAGPDDEGIGVGLCASITASGLSDRVSFIGTVDGREKRALLQRSDVFVLPSAHESFGIAVAEAMAVGCPVIVSPDVALADLIQAAGAGIVAEREAGAISRAIARILADRSAAKAMGVAGRRLVEVEFTSGGIATRLEALYRTVLAGPSSQAAKPSANARR